MLSNKKLDILNKNCLWNSLWLKDLIIFSSGSAVFRKHSSLYTVCVCKQIHYIALQACSTLQGLTWEVTGHMAIWCDHLTALGQVTLTKSCKIFRKTKTKGTFPTCWRYFSSVCSQYRNDQFCVTDKRNITIWVKWDITRAYESTAEIWVHTSVWMIKGKFLHFILQQRLWNCVVSESTHHVGLIYDFLLT